MHIHKFVLRLMGYVKKPFNFSDYNEEELTLLYQYQKMLLDEEICSPDYISTAREVLSRWGDGRGLLIEIETPSFKPFHKSESYENLTKHSLEYLMARKPLSDDIEIDLYNKMLLIRKYFDDLDSEEKESFINLTKFIGVFLLLDLVIHDALSTVHLTHLIVGSVENVNQLFSKIEFESYMNCLETVGNGIWGEFSINEMQEKPDEQLKILQKISSLRGVEGINMTLNLVADKKSYDMFFAQLESNDITQDNIDDVMEVIPALLYNKEGMEDSNIGFATSKLMPLVDKFRMPTNILKRAFDEIGSITREDNIRTILAPGNIEDTPIEIGTFRAKIGSNRSKTYTIEFLPKSSPIGLFFGKMTKSCQFYSGQSSDQAVIPIFTDPNEGLIVVRQGESSIKMGSFVWLCKDASGNIGIVLDSIEKAGSELSKIEPIVLQHIFRAFSNKDISVYLGTGGNTSKLSYSKTSQEKLGISPMSEGYIAYDDSRELYVVTEELETISEERASDKEHINDITFLKSEYKKLTDEEKLLVENVLQTLPDHSFIIQKLVLNKGINFIDAVKYYDLYKNYINVEFAYVNIKLVQNNKFDVISSILTELGKGIDEYNYIISNLISFCSSEEASTFLIKFGSNKEILLGLFAGKFSCRSEIIKILNSLDEEATSDFLNEYEHSGYDFYVFEKLFPSMQKYAFRFAKYFDSWFCEKILELTEEKMKELYNNVREIKLPENNRDLYIKLIDFSREEVIAYKHLLEKACVNIEACRKIDILEEKIKSYILDLEIINEKVGKAILQVANLGYFSGNQSIEIFKKFIEFNEKFPLAFSCLPEKSLEFIDLAFVDLLSKFYISNDFVDFILDNKDNSMLQDFLQNAILQKSENGIVWTYINTNISIIESDFKAFSESYIGAETCDQIGDRRVVELVGEIDAAGAAES